MESKSRKDFWVDIKPVPMWRWMLLCFASGATCMGITCMVGLIASLEILNK